VNDKETVFYPDIIQVHIKLTEKHLNHLKKINYNISESVRKIIDEDIKNKKIVFYEKHLISFSIGIILLGFGVIISNIYVMLAMYLTGIFMMGFSLTQYIKGAIRYDKETKKI